MDFAEEVDGVPISHLDFKFIETCQDSHQLEKILKTLRYIK